MTPDLDALARDLSPAYALGPLLGKGAFGAVHRARDVAAGRDVAIKLLNTDRQGAAAQRFLREATVAAALEHPGVIKVHAVGHHSRRLAIVYELVEGTTFSAAARTRSLRERAALVRDAARAVGHAHAHGVVHRDLKPDNLLVDATGRLRVADFGLAWHEGADRLTRTGAMVGTPTYMAPELFDGRHAATPASDVWALGVILYEALAGRVPFDGPDLVVLMARLQHATLVRPRDVDPAIDPGLEAVCLRALQREPSLRFSDAGAMADALDEALAGRSREGRRGGVNVLAGLAAFAALAGAAGLVVARTGREQAPVAPPSGPTPQTTPGPVTAPADDAPLRDRQLLQARTARWALWVDARRVLTGGPDDDVRLFHAATGEQLRSWPRPATTAAWLGDGRVALGTDEGLFVLAVDGRDPPGQLGALQEVRTIACAGDTGHLAVIGRADGDPSWRVLLVSPDGRHRAPSRTPYPSFTPLTLTLTTDGRSLAVTYRDPSQPPLPADVPAWQHPPQGPLIIYDVGDAGKVVDRLTVALIGTTISLRFVGSGDVLLAGSTVGQIGMIPRDAEEMEDHLRPPGSDRYAHEGAVRALAVSPDGRRLFSVADHPGGLELKAWDPASRAELKVVRAPGSPLTLDLAPGAKAVVIGTKDGGVHVRALDDLP